MVCLDHPPAKGKPPCTPALKAVPRIRDNDVAVIVHGQGLDHSPDRLGNDPKKGSQIIA